VRKTFRALQSAAKRLGALTIRIVSATTKAIRAVAANVTGEVKGLLRKGKIVAWRALKAVRATVRGALKTFKETVVRLAGWTELLIGFLRKVSVL